MAAIFSLFTEKKIKPEWEFDAGELIWRIFFAPVDRIAGEVRDQDNKATTYFCIDAKTGKALWKNIGFDESWWIGVEAIYDKWMILHGFVRPDMPEHHGIRVIEIETGRSLWRNEDVSFWFTYGEKLFAHKYIFEKRIGYEIDIQSGNVLQEYDKDFDILQGYRQKASQQAADYNEGVIYPETFDDSDEDQTINSAVNKIISGNAIQDWTEYLFYRDVVVVSYYCKSAGDSEKKLLDQVLTIYGIKNDKIIHSETIVKGVQSPSSDTFFIKNDLLYFIKHKKILTALSPWTY
jgi:hypothetical protein